MSGIIGSKLNHRGSGLVGSLGTDGQHLLSSGAGKSATFETPPSATFDDTDIRQDLITLAIHSAISDNKAAHNLPNSYIDQFEDSTDLNFTATTARASSGSDDFLVAGTAGPGPATYTSYATGSGTFTVPAGVTAFDVIVIGGGGASASSGNCGPTEAWGGGGAGGDIKLLTGHVKELSARERANHIASTYYNGIPRLGSGVPRLGSGAPRLGGRPNLLTSGRYRSGDTQLMLNDMGRI